MFLQVLINSLSIGLTYVLMASGLTLVFGILRIVNFAHGQLYMVGAFIFCVGIKQIGLNFFPSLLLSMIIVALIGVIIEKVFLRPLKDAPVVPLLTLTLGLLFIIEGVAEVVFGPDDKAIPKMFKGVYSIGNYSIAKDKIVIVSISLLIMIGLYYWIHKTKSGVAMRAVASDRLAARLQGIDEKKIAMIVMGIGSSLAGAAGALVSSMFYVNPHIGDYPLFKGLIVISLGGMGSLTGATIGGLLLGVVEGIGQTYLDPAITDIFAFVMVMIILLLRPQGLFGVPYEISH